MKQFSVVRTRYVIVRDEKEIFCGIMRSYKFVPFDKVKNTSLKTYESQTRAWASFKRYYSGYTEEEQQRYRVVPVVESIIATGSEFEKRRRK